MKEVRMNGGLWPTYEDPAKQTSATYVPSIGDRSLLCDLLGKQDLATCSQEMGVAVQTLRKYYGDVIQQAEDGKHVPTTTSRWIVNKLATYGTASHAKIAKIMGIPKAELEQMYNHELETGAALMTAAVADKQYEAAMAGSERSMEFILTHNPETKRKYNPNDSEATNTPPPRIMITVADGSTANVQINHKEEANDAEDSHWYDHIVDGAEADADYSMAVGVGDGTAVDSGGLLDGNPHGGGAVHDGDAGEGKTSKTTKNRD